jgi:hypothetical protein
LNEILRSDHPAAQAFCACRKVANRCNGLFAGLVACLVLANDDPNLVRFNPIMSGQLGDLGLDQFLDFLDRGIGCLLDDP